MSEEILFLPCRVQGCKNKVRPPKDTCKSCQIIIDNKATRKATLGAEAAAKVKEASKALKEKAAAAEAQAEAEAIEQWDSPEPVKKAEAKDILRDFRNLTQGYVVNAAYEAGVIAAKRLRLVPNRHFWKHGVLSALESQKAGEDVDVLPAYNDTKAHGEVFREQDQIALWDFATSWREQPATRAHDWEEGHRITLEEYRQLRHLKGDPIKMGNRLLDREFEQDPHGQWQDLHPVPKIDLLPENYSQAQFNEVLESLHEFTQYLIMASRDMFKSSWVVLLVIAFQITYYDLSVLIASATASLAEEFITAIRKKFLIDYDLTLFQQIYPEVVLWDDSGRTTTYENPAARLQLPQPSIFAVGLGGNPTGKRCHWCVGDDVCIRDNSHSPELRASTQESWELLTQTVAAQGWVTLLGTPYAPGDIYAVTLERAEVNTEKSIAYRIDPAFTINDLVRRKEVFEKPELVKTLKEEECTLLFPKRYTWAKIRYHMLNSELRTFLQQRLLRWVDANDDIKLNFEREDLEKALLDKVPDSCDITQIILCVDRGLSIKPRADRSSISALKFYRNEAGYPSLNVVHNRADRWPTSKLAEQIADCYELYRPDVVITEQDVDFQSLLDAVQIECDKRGMSINIFVAPISNTRKSKQIKFKGLEGLLNTGRLTFVRGPWIEDLFGEFLWLDGDKRSNGHNQKDDRCDSVAIGAALLPSPQTEDQHKATLEAKEKFDEQMKRAKQYEVVFGSRDYVKNGIQDAPRPAEDGNDEGYNPLLRVLSKGGFTKHSAKKIETPANKPAHLSFSSAPRVAR